jgi:hypothetical protein
MLTTAGSSFSAICEKEFDMETGSGMVRTGGFCSLVALTPPDTMLPMMTPMLSVATISVR